MRIIKTNQVIDVLRRAEALPAVLLDLVEDYFLLLNLFPLINMKLR
ncbi:hypothetical protein OB236_30760 [Paenibacillus sp. WQ 127069]|uniref:Uncharacterized protein n=1 Tax=Paenibacillus baimaensis TaxID=2982185 RepID=A0ABT2UPD9_9BACL|nr:hypothetical protein [Paenibacillus sp. WQ 127069]MCU6796515.1 hypothetical protein [Paenibacillus sp. WQ 127069]